MTRPELTPQQQLLVDVVSRYPGRFTRSGLAKMLVGARSWQETELPEYGQLAEYGRKELTYQIDILLQQRYLQLDSNDHLVPPSQ
jgi:hypothetical protein